jgi:nucleoside-diphosphate-sugar epimerase
VTGAAGFLGMRVVEALLERGHEVRAVVRGGESPRDGRVAVVRADVRRDDLAAAVEGADAVVHLAARVEGSDDERFAGTVAPTERLFEAAAGAGVGRIVLASSYAVYDWSLARGVLHEETPLEGARLYERDGYAIAKVWQERVARREAARTGIELVVLRPGFIWGPGRMELAGAGIRIGDVQLVVGPAARLPLTYVDNCADCFAAAVEVADAAGETFNVVDGDGVTAWRYARVAAGAGRRVPVPYAAARAVAALAHATARAAFPHGGRLPGILVPRRIDARFRPLRHSAERARRVLGWEPRVPFEEALRRSAANRS